MIGLFYRLPISKVLHTCAGTFITEWEPGAKIWKRIFDENREGCIVEQLVAVAVKYNFDGWLINVENPIDIEHLERLRDFVAYLTKRCRQELGEQAEVQWQAF